MNQYEKGRQSTRRRAEAIAEADEAAEEAGTIDPYHEGMIDVTA